MKNLLCVLAFLGAYMCAAQNVNVRLRAQVNYPNQSLANIGGFSKNGREYALLGANLGMIIVDVSNPDAPQTIKQIPGVNNLWKEIKVYKNYAYITSEGGTGLQIVHLSNLPDSNLQVRQYTGDGAIAGALNRIHALHIDTLRGYVYLYGATGLANGGAVVLNLEPDPFNPRYVGQYNANYIHDGYVHNDTLWAAHINNGYFAIIDFRNKSNPLLINTQNTPTTFTHNTWLTDDRRALLTTDENNNSYLAAYDISNPLQIRFLDKIQSTPGSGSIVHNTHIKNDYAVTSWYTDGITITDAHRPQNLIQVGNYDCYPQGGGGNFEGTWGVFPFFASGTIVASNMEGNLYVLTPEYKRACYLEGLVVDSLTRVPLPNVTVKINSSDHDKRAKSNNMGAFYTGQVTPGVFTATFTAAGYVTKTISVDLSAGVVLHQTVELVKKTTYNFSGRTVKADNNGNPSNDGLASTLQLVSNQGIYELYSDNAGNFSLNNVIAGTYQLFVGAWGYRHKSISLDLTEHRNNLVIGLQEGYQDDFWGDFGWTTTGNAPRGMWVRDIPLGTMNGNAICNPNTDHPNDIGNMCYMTGNGGAPAGNDDLDEGYTLLTSPILQTSHYLSPELRFSYWFYNAGGTGAPNDSLISTVSMLLGGVWRDTVVRVITQSASSWRSSGKINLSPFRPSQVRVRFWANDSSPGHLVEAAIDSFAFYDAATTHVAVLDPNILLKVYPNPSDATFNIDYQFVTSAKDAYIELYDVLGKSLWRQSIDSPQGTIPCHQTLPAGVYSLRIIADNRLSRVLKIVRL